MAALVGTMELPNSVGERIHVDVEWDALSTSLVSQSHNPQKQVTLLADNIPGCGAIACAGSDSLERERVARCQEHIDSIFNDPANANKTGAELDLIGIPGTLCKTPLQTLVANSSVLTPGDISKCRRKTHGAAKYFIMFMSQPTEAGGYAGLHLEALLIPESEKDEVTAVTVAHTYEGDDNTRARTWLTDLFKVNGLGVPPPSSDFQRLFASPEGDTKLGPRNIVVPLSKDELWGTIVETLALQKQYSTPSNDAPIKRVMFPVDILISFDLTQEEHSRFMDVKRLHEISVGRGKIMPLGYHTGCNSCAAFTLALLAHAAPRHFSAIDPHATHLDVLCCTALTKADERFLPRNGQYLRIYDVLDSDRRAKKFEAANLHATLRMLDRITSSNEMYKLVIPGFSSWGRHYMSFQRRHPLETAAGVYRLTLKVIEDVLKIRAEASDQGRNNSINQAREFIVSRL